MKKQHNANQEKHQEQSQANQLEYSIEGNQRDQKNQEAEEWKQKYLRVLADYQNLEKRSLQEKEDVQKFAAEVTLRKMIPAIDTLERAAKHIDDEGLRLSLREFYSILETCGVKKIETVGKSFDPHLMECVEVIEAENEGHVVEEVRAGYMLFDKVLRVAQVKVSKKKEV